MLTLKPGELEPIPLYWYYQNQAEELNRVTYRLNKVLSAIRVRGAYNNLLSDDLQKILADTETENALVPAGKPRPDPGVAGLRRIFGFCPSISW